MTFDTPISNRHDSWLREIADMEHDANEPAAAPSRIPSIVALPPRAPVTPAVREAFAEMDSYAVARSKGRPAVEPAAFLMARQAS